MEEVDLSKPDIGHSGISTDKSNAMSSIKDMDK